MRCSMHINRRDNRKRCRPTPPPMMHDNARVTSLKILGVTFTDTLSVSVHVDDVIYSSARSMYAIRVLQSHGMSVSALLQQVFHAVVISKLTYASPAAWWGFTTSTDRQRIDAVLRRVNKSGFWTSAVPSDFPTFVYWHIRRIRVNFNDNALSYLLTYLLTAYLQSAC